MTTKGMAYLAEPIDQVGPGNSELAMIRRVLSDAGWVVYSPRTAWWVNEGVDPTPKVEFINRQALMEADLLVAYLPPGVPTVGVPREIEAAVMSHIPVIAVGQYSRQRFALADVACVDGAQELEGVLADNPYRLSGSGMEDLRRFHAAATISRPAPLTNEEMEAIRPIEQEPQVIGYELQYKSAPRATELLPNVARWASGADPRSYPGDAGLDLFAADYTVIAPGGYGRVPCGVQVALPEGVFGWVVARSSTFADKRLIVLPGVIDTGYRGELEAVVWNTDSEFVGVQPGDRIAQLILLPNLAAHTRLKFVGELPASERGSNGFGSSNRVPIYDDRGTD